MDSQRESEQQDIVRSSLPYLPRYFYFEVEDDFKLDQLWAINLSITITFVEYPIDQVSDHNFIQVKIEAVCIEKEPKTQPYPGEVDV